jgi:hypothetical protein
MPKVRKRESRTAVGCVLRDDVEEKLSGVLADHLDEFTFLVLLEF